MRSVVVFSFTLALAACGGSDHHAYSCAIDSVSSSSCQELTASSSDAQFACNAVSGTLTEGNTCPTTGVLGTCDVRPDNGIETFIYIYSGGGVTTQAEAMAACTQDDGTFTAGS
jgi:hypothetical protein